MSKMDEFKEYLKDTHKCKTLDSLQKKFDEIALHFIKYGVIVAQETNEFFPTEIEIYFNDQIIHNDIYTHGCPELPKQLEFGSWYLHRYHRGDITKRFTNKLDGIDVTFGNKEEDIEKEGEKKIYAGILIRSIKKKTNKGENPLEIEGPNNSFQELFGFRDDNDKKKKRSGVFFKEEKYNLEKLFEPIEIKETAFTKNSIIYIKFSEDTDSSHKLNEPICKARRKLGKARKEDTNRFYHKQRYRYFSIEPKDNKPQDCRLLEGTADKTDCTKCCVRD